LADASSLNFFKMKARYPVDFALTDASGTVRRWLEVKCRNNPKGKYPTYMLGLGKFIDMMNLQSASQIRALLAVRWADQVGVLAIQAPIEVMIGGRTDRGDPQDREPCVFFPVSSFATVLPRSPPMM